MFGIKYFTKVCSLFGDNFAQSKEMFSNPMFLMALMDGKENDLSKLMLLTNLGQGKEMNPLALMLLTKGEGKNDLSTIALMSMLNNGTNIFNTNSKVNTVKEN